MKFSNIRGVISLLTVLIASAGCSGLLGSSNLEATLPSPGLRIVDNDGSLPDTGSDPSFPDSQVPGGAGFTIGAESRSLDFQDLGYLYKTSGIRMVRYNGLLWPDIEPNPGDRNWDELSELEQKLIAASENGLEVILIVRGTPEWAQQVPGSFCGPIQQEQLPAFASFLNEAVTRYGSPPYNVKYWELGNEPDVDPGQVTKDSVFGCWGNKGDEYFGGGYYAEMLKVAYPAIKSANPEVSVLLGGLLLDCDPENPPEDKDCSSGKFFEGIMRNGGGDYFDLVSYHGYASYIGPSYDLGNALRFDDHHPSWEHLGGVVLGKVYYLRQLMNEYNVVKPIMLTEGSLICPEVNLIDCVPPDPGFYEAQADYVVRLIVRTWANNLAGTIWYQFEGPGWRYSGLLNEEQVPKLAFNAMSFLNAELSAVRYSKTVTEFENLEGYEFHSSGKLIWVIWSTDQIDTQIQLPENTLEVYDKFGENITPEAGEITINDPVYIELTP